MFDGNGKLIEILKHITIVCNVFFSISGTLIMYTTYKI